MNIRAALFLLAICTACQSGKIPCPEIKTAKFKESRPNKGNRFMASPSRMMASAKTTPIQEGTRQEVNLERMKATRVTGKQMLEQYGSVEEWDCPSPYGKKKYSKVTKENIRKNEKRMREHLKERSASDSLAITPPLDLH
jgi:hypothetical protein